MGIKHFGTDNCLWDTDAQPLLVLQEQYQTQRLTLYWLKAWKGKNNNTILNGYQCKQDQDMVE